jgi:hypothetical protein
VALLGTLEHSFQPKEAILRPRLDPAMGMVPISARVACQLVKLEYDKARCTHHNAGVYARQVLLSLPLEVDGIVRLALHSLGVYLDLGYTGNEWLSAVLEASHYGHSFRRCFFFDYKEQRRPYPRVTNRGVQTSPPASNGRVRKGRINA